MDTDNGLVEAWGVGWGWARSRWGEKGDLCNIFNNKVLIKKYKSKLNSG